MNHRTRALTSSFLFSVVAVGGLVAGRASAYDGEEPEVCTAKKFQVAQVEAACKKDGRKGAKALMKKVVKDQKAAGNDINCKTCHESLKTFDLESNAVADLKKYLG